MARLTVPRESAWQTSCAGFVADFVFSDGRDYGSLTETYREALGLVGVQLAQVCENVAELSAAIPIWYKGGPNA